MFAVNLRESLILKKFLNPLNAEKKIPSAIFCHYLELTIFSTLAGLGLISNSKPSNSLYSLLVFRLI